MKGATRNRKLGVMFLDLISIHAPMKGATKICCDDKIDAYISIHAPMKGATRFGIDDIEVDFRFQSTHP